MTDLIVAKCVNVTEHCASCEHYDECAVYFEPFDPLASQQAFEGMEEE